MTLSPPSTASRHAAAPFGLPVSLRTQLAGLAAAGAVTFIAALGLQHVLGLEPCPLCIVQRLILAAFILLAGGAALFRARPVHLATAGVLVLLAMTGAGTAGWQLWLQAQPVTQAAGCGPGLAFMVETMSVAQWLPALFAATGQCTQAQPVLGPLGTPHLSLLAFLALDAGATLALVLGARRTAGQPR